MNIYGDLVIICFQMACLNENVVTNQKMLRYVCIHETKMFYVNREQMDRHKHTLSPTIILCVCFTYKIHVIG